MSLLPFAPGQHRQLLTGFTFIEMTCQRALTSECSNTTADDLQSFVAPLKYTLRGYNRLALLTSGDETSLFVLLTIARAE